MMSAEFFRGNVLLGGELQIDVKKKKKSNSEIFESAKFDQKNGCPDFKHWWGQRLGVDQQMIEQRVILFILDTPTCKCLSILQS